MGGTKVKRRGFKLFRPHWNTVHSLRIVLS